MEEQERIRANLSDNARFVLSAASLLTAAFAAFPVGGTRLGSWQTGISLVIYLGLAWSALQGFRLQKFDFVPPTPGLRIYLEEDEEYTKRKIFAAMVKTFKTNEIELDKKTCWADRAQRMLVVQTVWLLVTTLWREVS